MDSTRRYAVLALTCAVLLGASACTGRSIRSSTRTGPELTSARLGGLRSAMTYDGDWLGGMPAPADLASDLELAARRGVEAVVDMRSPEARSAQSLEVAVEEVGLAYVSVPLGDGVISDAAVDRTLEILREPGRGRLLLVDDDGTLSSMVYAIHLAVDEGVEPARALRAARATGIDQSHEEFVRRQVERLTSKPS